MTFLLDVNVLIALLDPGHVNHDDAHTWFESAGHRSWATCPLTQNGVIRILGQAAYPNSPGPPAVVVPILTKMTSLQGHIFWPDRISLLDQGLIEPDRMLTPGQVTDSYLLALARAQDGQLATFDRRLSTMAVRDGKAALHLIGS